MLKDYSKELTENGFSSLRFLKATRKNTIYLAKRDSEPVFVKITSDPAVFDNIKTEVVANNFIREKALNLPLKIPKSELIEGNGYLIGYFERIKHKPLASQEEHKLFYTPNDDDLSKLYDILSFFASIKKDELPNYLLEKTKTVHNADAFKEKVKSSIGVLGGLMSIEEKELLEHNFARMEYHAHFSHHDFAPWNMFKDDDESFILADSEFARWGMRWYDEAYFFLKTYVSLESPDVAKRSLDYFIKRFKENPLGKNIEREIMVPLHYIIIPTLLEAETEKRKLLAKEMLGRILTAELREVLE